MEKQDIAGNLLESKKIKMKDYYCDYCKCGLSYSSEFDDIYCKNCDTWDEECNDREECPFCEGRPEKPSDYYDQ